MIYDKPSYEIGRNNPPVRVREVLRIWATLDKPDVAREIILEWLENEAKTDLPEPAWQGGAFQHRSGERSFTAVSAVGDTVKTWALRYVEPEEAGRDRVWTTEVAISERRGRKPRISIRVMAKSAEIKLRIQPVVPRFFEHVANECNLQQGNVKIERDPWIIESDYDATTLTEFLVDPERHTPAFVLTVPEEAEDPNEPVLDPLPLSRDTLGIAKVIVLPAEFTWKLTNRFGKRLSVYRGAMRVYLPGFSDRANPEGGHDLFMPHRMSPPEAAAKLGSLLRWIAARESLRRVRLDQDVLPFATVLVSSIDLETARLQQTGASESDQLTASKQHLGILSNELRLAQQIQQWLTEENKAIEGRVRETEAKLRAAQYRSKPPVDRFQRTRQRPKYQPFETESEYDGGVQRGRWNR